MYGTSECVQDPERGLANAATAPLNVVSFIRARLYVEIMIGNTRCSFDLPPTKLLAEDACKNSRRFVSMLTNFSMSLSRCASAANSDSKQHILRNYIDYTITKPY
jgi:hypothetical protein